MSVFKDRGLGYRYRFSSNLYTDIIVSSMRLNEYQRKPWDSMKSLGRIGKKKKIGVVRCPGSHAEKVVYCRGKRDCEFLTDGSSKMSTKKQLLYSSESLVGLKKSSFDVIAGQL